MSTKYSDLLVQLVDRVGDVTDVLVDIVFRSSLCAFMRESQCWRTHFGASLADAVDHGFDLPAPVLTVADPDAEPPVLEVLYRAVVDPVLRVRFDGANAHPYWRLNNPTAAGSPQRLVLLHPISQCGTGYVQARLCWVPMFDATPETGVPDWVIEQHGNVICDWTVGELFWRGHGRRADKQQGAMMKQLALDAARGIRAQTNGSQPGPIET